MVTESKRGSTKKKKVKVLKLTRETVRTLGGEAKRVKGGGTGLCLTGPQISSVPSVAQSLSKGTVTSASFSSAGGTFGSTTSF